MGEIIPISSATRRREARVPTTGDHAEEVVPILADYDEMRALQARAAADYFGRQAAETEALLEEMNRAGTPAAAAVVLRQWAQRRAADARKED